MANLVDLKYTPKEVKEEKAEMSSCLEVPDYPWGLKLRLEKEEIDKLGIATLPSVGDEYLIYAVGRVESVAQAYRGDDESTCIEIQLVMMQVEQDDGDKQSKSKPASNESLQSMLSYYQSKR